MYYVTLMEEIYSLSICRPFRRDHYLPTRVATKSEFDISQDKIKKTYALRSQFVKLLKLIHGLKNKDF